MGRFAIHRRKFQLFLGQISEDQFSATFMPFARKAGSVGGFR